MLTRWSRRRKELEEEIQAHIALETEENLEAGMPPEEARLAARLAARRKFGNQLLALERSREMWGALWLERLARDLRFGLRSLRKSPGFAFTAILTLALGIGATTGIFSLTRALLFDPLPVSDPGSLVRISLVVRNGGSAVPDLPLNRFIIASLRRHATLLSGIFGWSPYNFVLKQDTGLHIYDGAMVSGDTFQVLGLGPRRAVCSAPTTIARAVDPMAGLPSSATASGRSTSAAICRSSTNRPARRAAARCQRLAAGGGSLLSCAWRAGT